MNTSTKRGIAAGSSVALVGAIVAGVLFASSAIAQPAPSPTSVVEITSPSAPTDLEQEALAEAEAQRAAEAEAARVEAERVAAEAAAAEAARVEAERVAAEQAAAEQAARDETFEEAPSEQAEPFAPTLCPEGTVPMDVDAAGNQSNCQASYNQDVVVP